MPAQSPGDQSKWVLPVSEIDLGSNPRDPVITEILQRNLASVRLRNAVLVAEDKGLLLVQTVSQYMALGTTASDAFMRRVHNLGRCSASELDQLVRQADLQVRRRLQTGLVRRILLSAQDARHEANLFGETGVGGKASTLSSLPSPPKPEEVCAALTAPFRALPVSAAIGAFTVPPRLPRALKMVGAWDRPLAELLSEFAVKREAFLALPNFGAGSMQELRAVLIQILARHWGANGLAGHDLHLAVESVVDRRRLPLDTAIKIASVIQPLAVYSEPPLRVSAQGGEAQIDHERATAALLKMGFEVQFVERFRAAQLGPVPLEHEDLGRL